MTNEANKKKLSDDTKERIKALSQEIKDTSTAEYYYRCGILYNTGCDPESAIQSYSKAIELNPEYVNAYLGRGGCYDEKREYSKAIKDYSLMIEIKPECGTGYLNRGISYYEQEKYLEAREDLEKYLNIEEYNEKRMKYVGPRCDGVDIARKILKNIENKQSEKTND